MFTDTFGRHKVLIPTAACGDSQFSGVQLSLPGTDNILIVGFVPLPRISARV